MYECKIGVEVSLFAIPILLFNTRLLYCLPDFIVYKKGVYHMENMIYLSRSIFLSAILSGCSVHSADHNAANYITNITQNIIVINVSTKSLGVMVEQTCQREAEGPLTYGTSLQRIDAGKFFKFEYDFLQAIQPKVLAISQVKLLLKHDNNQRFEAVITPFIEKNPVVIVDMDKNNDFVCKNVHSPEMVTLYKNIKSYSESYTCFTVKNLHNKAVTGSFKYGLLNLATAPLTFKQHSGERVVIINPREYGLFYYCSAIYTCLEDENTERQTTKAVTGKISFTEEGKTIYTSDFSVSPRDKIYVERYVFKSYNKQFSLSKENN